MGRKCHGCMVQGAGLDVGQREFFIDNLLVQIHFIFVMTRWTGLAPWEFKFPFPGSLTCGAQGGARPVLDQLRSRISGFGFRVPGFVFRASCFVFRVSGFGFGISSLGAGVCFGAGNGGISGLGFEVWGFTVPDDPPHSPPGGGRWGGGGREREIKRERERER